MEVVVQVDGVRLQVFFRAMFSVRATADIEMTRIKGVHGPRFLHVLLVRDDSIFRAAIRQRLDSELVRPTESDGLPKLPRAPDEL